MPQKSKKTPEQVPVVIDIQTSEAKPVAKEAKPVAKEAKTVAKEAKTVAKEIEANPVAVDKVPVIRTKIKAPRTPYTAYISKNFKEYKGTGKSNGEIFKELAKAWGGMSPEQKAGYKV